MQPWQDEELARSLTLFPTFPSAQDHRCDVHYQVSPYWGPAVQSLSSHCHSPSPIHVSSRTKRAWSAPLSVFTQSTQHQTAPQIFAEFWIVHDCRFVIIQCFKVFVCTGAMSGQIQSVLHDSTSNSYQPEESCFWFVLCYNYAQCQYNVSETHTDYLNYTHYTDSIGGAHTQIPGIIDRAQCPRWCWWHTQISEIINWWCSARNAAGDDSSSQWFWYLYLSDNKLKTLSSLKYLFNLHII